MLKPLGDRVVVERVEEETTTKSGIVLPDTAKEKPQRGKVISIGEGRWDEKYDHRVPMDVKKGDVVLFAKYGGTEVEIEGNEYIVLSERDLLAIVD